MIDFDSVLKMITETSAFFNNTHYEIHQKGKSDYVTDIDIKIQSFIKKRLHEINGEIPILSEESEPFDILEDTSCWILDPIDGTTNFIHNYQSSVISLALFTNSDIEFGVVFNPYSNELFTARKGKGAYLNGVKISSTCTTDIEKSLIAIGTSPYCRDTATVDFDIFRKVFLSCQDIRRSGSAALDIAYVACGRVEAFFERNLKPWDYAAGTILLREAGGRITDWNNNSVRFSSTTNVIASNTYMHDYLLNILIGA